MLKHNKGNNWLLLDKRRAGGFPQRWISDGDKTVRTTFWCIIVLQLRGEGPEKAHNYGTDSGKIFRTFSPQLENNDTVRYSSDSFAHTLRYVVNVENCQNYIEMYQYPPITGIRSWIALKLGGLRISRCNIYISLYLAKKHYWEP